MSAQRTLMATTLLTAVFAASQLVGAVVSHSLSLLGDSGDMAVDALTYALAYYVERKRPRQGSLSRRLWILENLVIALSGVTLVLGSVVLLEVAIVRLKGKSDEDDSVDADIIGVFATMNLVIDVIQCVLFLKRYAVEEKPHAEKCAMLASQQSAAAQAPLVETVGGEVSAMLQSDQQLEANARSMTVSNTSASTDNLNESSAFAHVSADTLRTVSELVCAFLIKFLKTDPVKTDAITSAVINVTILLSGLYILRSLASRCRGQRGAPYDVSSHGEAGLHGILENHLKENTLELAVATEEQE